MQPSILWLPYLANIFILVPVCWQMMAGRGVEAVFDGRVDESEGLRIMTGSLWTAILVASVVGLFAPRLMMPLLAVQVFYKSLWLIRFIRPRMAQVGWAGVPHGITICFVVIALGWPVFILIEGVTRGWPSFG